MRREDRLVAFVDRVAHRLADEMVGDGVHGEFVPFEQIAFGGAVAAVFQSLGHIEVVAPAGQLQAGVAKLAGLAGQILKRHIGPLAGEERDGAGHGMFLSSGGQNREQKRRGFCQNSCVLQPVGIGWDQGRCFRRQNCDLSQAPLCVNQRIRRMIDADGALVSGRRVFRRQLRADDAAHQPHAP